MAATAYDMSPAMTYTVSLGFSATAERLVNEVL